MHRCPVPWLPWAQQQASAVRILPVVEAKQGQGPCSSVTLLPAVTLGLFPLPSRSANLSGRSVCPGIHTVSCFAFLSAHSSGRRRWEPMVCR